jgi:hypothetical protein
VLATAMLIISTAVAVSDPALHVDNRFPPKVFPPVGFGRVSVHPRSNYSIEVVAQLRYSGALTETATFSPGGHLYDRAKRTVHRAETIRLVLRPGKSAKKIVTRRKHMHVLVDVVLISPVDGLNSVGKEVVVHR